MNAIVFANVSKSYGSVPAVRGLDLTIDAGETVALLGPNGAGKSTSIAHWLPSSRFFQLGWDVAGGHAPAAAAGLILAAWSVALGGGAVMAYRRATLSA